MTIHNIAYIDGKYQVYATVNGIYRLNVGPRWLTPREAARYAETLDKLPQVDPLRDGRDANTDGPLSVDVAPIT
jgi:hypothetical protein